MTTKYQIVIADRGWVYAGDVERTADGITITKDYVHIRGQVLLGGAAPNPAMALMMGPNTPNVPYIIPVTGAPTLPTNTTLLPVPGVFVCL